MKLRRYTTLAISSLVASLLPVMSFSPAYAAPETDLVSIPVSSWSPPELRAQSVGDAWRTSAEVPAGDTVLIGADWGGGEDVEVEARTRSGDTWTDWAHLHVSPDHGPDEGARSTTGSDPLWVGIVDGLQFRTTAADPSSVRIQGVVVEGGERALARTPDSARPASSAEAVTTRPDIITRAEWGANESLRNGSTAYADTVRFAAVHHTSGSNSYQPWESDDLVRSIYAYHTNSRGWDDIGYNFLVDRFGQVFEGRAGGVEQPVIGAHASGFNSGATGVAIMGNFESASPPAAALDALTQLLSWKLDVHHVDPLATTNEVAGKGSRYPEGSNVTLPTIIGHRDSGYTACPGARLYDHIENGTIARDVAAMGTPNLYTSAPASVRQARGGTMKVPVRPSTQVNYVIRVLDDQDAVVHRVTGSTDRAFNATWDQTGPDGRLVPAGTYRMVISATAGSAAAHPITVANTIVIGLPERDPNARPTPPPAGAVRLSGDWNGDGQDTPGWFKDGRWGMHDRSHAEGNTTLLSYGQPGDRPVVGDWDGDGVDTVGVVRGNLWILRNEYRRGAEDIVMRYGEPGDVPVTGDYDGNGTDTLGVVRGNLWILRNEYRRGAEDIVMRYGEPSDVKVTGDWDGDGIDTLGVVRGNLFILRSEYRRGADDVVMAYGEAGDAKVTGNWNADRRDTLGIVRDTLWVLRNEYRRGAIDYTFQY